MADDRTGRSLNDSAAKGPLERDGGNSSSRRPNPENPFAAKDFSGVRPPSPVHHETTITPRRMRSDIHRFRQECSGIEHSGDGIDRPQQILAGGAVWISLI
jgi:hypothetical protein